MKEQFPLAEFVIRELVYKDGDDYVLHPRAQEGFKLALDDVFGSDLDPRAQIEAVARLGSLFESTYHAFTAADGIARLLAGDDRALALLALPAGKRARSMRNQFKRLSGDNAGEEAPLYGEAAPEGSLKLKTFLQPGREIRRRQKR